MIMSVFLPLSITVVSLLSWKFVMSRKQLRSYPPGPEPQLLIGNLLEFPTKDVANVYIEWGKKYNSELNELPRPFLIIWLYVGSVLYASALGSHVVVLNKLEDALELFERRARIYSDRPEYALQKL